MSENTSNWIEKDSPEYFDFIQDIQENSLKPYGPGKKMIWVIWWNYIRTKDKASHLFHNNYILTSVHFSNEEKLLKLCKKHNKMSDDGSKIMMFSDPVIQGYGENNDLNSTSLNTIATDLVERTNISVIREAEPGIPGVVRAITDVDEYGGRNLNHKVGQMTEFEPEIDTEVNKKAWMEAKEIEYRQGQNIEELKRIGILIHAMNSKNKQTEKKMRELEVQFQMVETGVEKLELA